MTGAVRALRGRGMAGRVAMVCNALRPENRAGLIDFVVTLVINPPAAGGGNAHGGREGRALGGAAGDAGGAVEWFIAGNV